MTSRLLGGELSQPSLHRHNPESFAPLRGIVGAFLHPVNDSRIGRAEAFPESVRARLVGFFIAPYD
jgi:hypothetical protein